MSASSELAKITHRLGLNFELDRPGFHFLSRRGLRVRASLPDSKHAGWEKVHELSWFLLGIRLGIDYLLPPDKPARTASALGFRRTAVVRYHEAPSIYGDALPFLVPELVIKSFEALTGKKVLSTPWIFEGFHLLLLEEKGLKQLITTRDQGEEKKDEDFEKARKALFYEAYKLKPSQKIEVPTYGQIRLFQSTEGMMASRATLLPEFDYDTAQDLGYLSIPTRDTFLIAAPENPGRSEELREALRRETLQRFRNQTFGMSNQIFGLSRDRLTPLGAEHWYPGKNFDELLLESISLS